MDFLIILLVIGFCLYKLMAPTTPPEEVDEVEETRPLTSTQRKWRAMKRESELAKLGEEETHYISKWEQTVQLQTEMTQYILDNKRKFHPFVWLIDAIDPRLIVEYIRKMIALVIFYLLLMWMFGAFSLLAIFVGGLVMDYLLYNKQLILEVTEWNPEYQEKFAKRYQTLGPFE